MATHIIAVSDLHLSATQTSVGENPKIREGFFYDDIFARFSHHLLSCAAEADGSWRLLILGDGVDFLHTRTIRDQNPLCPSSKFAETHSKLDLIFDAHPQFFASLGQLLANGFYIDIVPGNHDIEFVRSETQSHFRRLMQRHAPVDAINERLAFFSWLYHVPGILYAEHGNQYHIINSFTTLLVPLVNQHTGEVEHPLGTYFDLYLSYLREHGGPPKEDTSNLWGHILRELLKRPFAFMAQFPAHLHFFWQAVKFLFYRLSPWMTVKRRKYRRDNFPAYAKHVQFNQRSLAKLDNIAATPGTELLARVLGKLIFGRATNESHLQKSAQKIHAALKREREEVLFYLFGHSHTAAKLPIDEKSFYLNDGAWAPEEFPRHPDNKTNFPYVHIHWGDQAAPEAELKSWRLDV